MKFLNTYKVGIKDLPFALLVIDFIWWILSLFKVNLLDHWWIPEITGHSLFFVFHAVYYAIRHKHCLYTWVCLGGLGLLNVLNVLHFFVNFEYIQSYAGIIITTSIIFSLIKWKELCSKWLKLKF